MSAGWRLCDERSRSNGSLQGKIRRDLLEFWVRIIHVDVDSALRVA
jgi:hypothetical protein